MAILPPAVRTPLETLRHSRRVVALFGLMVLLPAAVFGVLIVRAARTERARRAYEAAQRQQQIVEFVEADFRNWLFSSGTGSARAGALVRFEVQGERIAFPDFGLSWPAADSPQLRPAEAGPPDGPLTPAAIAEHYFPRVQAFRRDRESGRNTGAQYFRQLRALIVQAPGAGDGYVLDIQDVLTYVASRLAAMTVGEPFTATAWMAAERGSRPPAGGFSIEGFPFLEIVFEDARASVWTDLRGLAFPYSMALLVLLTVVGSAFAYRTISQEARLAQLRNDFVAAVSHEFRSPLSSILALAERLERVSDPEKLREYHRIIGQDARRLSALVARLLDFAVIEEGRKVYDAERLDLADATRAAVESCQDAARPERIRFSAPGPLWTRGDRTALQHAIQNVIENAAKYSPPEAPIVVDCTSMNGGHVIEVRDRGIGIPREEQARIFDKFYRGRHVSGLNVQGVGIGLALVRHVIEGHGGSVSVESEPGAGSRFRLYLPSPLDEARGMET